MLSAEPQGSPMTYKTRTLHDEAQAFISLLGRIIIAIRPCPLDDLGDHTQQSVPSLFAQVEQRNEDFRETVYPKTCLPCWSRQCS